MRKKKNPAWLARCLCPSRFPLLLSFRACITWLHHDTWEKMAMLCHQIDRGSLNLWLRPRYRARIIESSTLTCRKWSTRERQWTLQRYNHAVAGDHNYSTINNGITELLWRPWRKCIRESFESRNNTIPADSMTRSANSGSTNRYDRCRGIYERQAESQHSHWFLLRTS
jgi:hypothetical protein